MEDQIFIRQLKQGNKLAFTEIYKLHSRQAFSLSFKYLCNKELAEDAVQNLFTKLWLRKEELQDDKPIKNYLFTILKNDLLNILRDSKKNIFIFNDCLETLQYIDSEDTDKQNIDQEQLEMIQNAVDQLPQKRKEIFLMKTTGKFSNQEIADKLNLSINTIKCQYSQSLKQVKKIIRENAICLLA